MTDRDRVKETAVTLKQTGYNCGQSLMKSFEAYTEGDMETQLMMTAGFGGGMGCMESTCGALTGAVMVMGLMRKGKAAVPVAKGMVNEFKNRCGATKCADLKGRDTGIMLCDCPDCIRNAVDIVFDTLELD